MTKYKLGNRGKTTRIIRLFSMLQSEEFISLNDLSQELGVVVRTLQRYLTEIEDAGVMVERKKGASAGVRIASSPVFRSSEQIITKEYEGWIAELEREKKKLKKEIDSLSVKEILKGRDPKKVGKNSKLAKRDAEYKKVKSLITILKKRIKGINESGELIK